MNKFCIALLVLPVLLCSGQISQTAGFLNDNYTGSEENGRKGRYIGADDFLTFGLFSHTRVEALDLSLSYTIVTSRQQNFRYDMVQGKFGYGLQYENLTLTPGLGFLVKGDLGGESFQNNFHSLRDIPALTLPYSGSDFSLVPGLSADYSLRHLWFHEDRFSVILHGEIPSGIKPGSAYAAVGYRLGFKSLVFDLVSGYKTYLTSQDEFSDFVRTGFVLGGQAVFTMKSGFSLNSGVYFFPVKNLENDPVYRDHEHDYSPQFWVSLGYNGDNFRIQDLINL